MKKEKMFKKMNTLFKSLNKRVITFINKCMLLLRSKNIERRKDESLNNEEELLETRHVKTINFYERRCAANEATIKDDVAKLKDMVLNDILRSYNLIL